MAEWEKVRIPLNTTPVKLPATTFTPTVDPSLMIDIRTAKAKMAEKSITLVDCRTPEEFVAQDKEKKSPGHIPGAIDFNYKEMLNADGSYKTKAELEAMATKFGIPADKELVFYCSSGVRAAVGYIAFKEILEFKDVKVLEGGLNHWVLDKGNTVETN
jgi:thiosulfate/3-mercaptopyruvate sulfurtransferase